MNDLVEANPKDFGDIMAEHIGHQNISILTLAHIHGVGYFSNDIQVGIKEFESSMEEVNLELFLLFPIGFPRKYLIDEFEMGCLHDVNDPAKAKLDSIFLNIVNCFSSFLMVLCCDYLQSPAAQKKILDYVIFINFGSLSKDTVKDKLDQMLQLHLEELSTHFKHHLTNRLYFSFILNLDLHELNKALNTFEDSRSDSILVTFFISPRRTGCIFLPEVEVCP